MDGNNGYQQNINAINFTEITVSKVSPNTAHRNKFNFDSMVGEAEQRVAQGGEPVQRAGPEGQLKILPKLILPDEGNTPPNPLGG